MEARWRSRLKLLSEVLSRKDHLDEDKMVEVFEAEPLDESEHGPGAKPGDLRVLSCVKLEGAAVPKYEDDIDVSPVYHPDAA